MTPQNDVRSFSARRDNRLWSTGNASLGGRSLKIIFQLKPGNIVRIITGWDV
jgi:hypothetical protein